jgi:DNA-directed RNA polymerase specialized sigma24 family protein
VPTANEEDLALSRRAAAGDRHAFALLVAKHERPLRAFLSRMAGPDVADDIAQEAFLKAWRSAGQYDGRARYSTWLTRIAWRCRIDQLRRERPVEIEDIETVGGAGGAEVNDMLARLRERERASLILCEGHGWSHAEAAEMLGMPLGTLKSTVARAKAKCRAMWSGKNDG